MEITPSGQKSQQRKQPGLPLLDGTHLVLSITGF
jgi:hypothetical protein